MRVSRTLSKGGARAPLYLFFSEKAPRLRCQELSRCDEVHFRWDTAGLRGRFMSQTLTSPPAGVFIP